MLVFLPLLLPTLVTEILHQILPAKVLDLYH